MKQVPEQPTRRSPSFGREVTARAAWTGAVLSTFVVALLNIRFDEVLAEGARLRPLRADPVAAGLAELGISEAFYIRFDLARMALVVALFYLIALVIAWKAPASWPAGFFALVVGLMGGLLLLDRLAPPPEMGFVGSLVATLAFSSFFFTFYLFPDGKLTPRWTRWMLGAWLFAVVGSSLPGTVLDPASWPAGPSLALSAALFVSCPMAQFVRYRRYSDAVCRQQTKWVVFGLAVTVVAFLGFWNLPALIPALTATPRAAAVYDLVGGSLLIVGFAAVPVTLGLALLRRRLWNIEPIIGRTLVFGGMTAIVVGLYVAIVGYLGTVLRIEGNLLVSLAATGVVAVAFQPLRARLQRGVNRLVYGRRDEPYEVVSELGRRLEQTMTPGDMLSTIVETVADALKLPYAAISVSVAGNEIASASKGEPVEGTILLPLTHGTENVGTLELAPRASGSGFAPGERRLLEDLARQAGVAAQAVRLQAELLQAREHLVLAREDERRRLRRDLHDGLGPQLAGQILTLAAIRRTLPRDREDVDAMLAGAIDNARSGIEDVRRITRGLRPPALDDLGLAGALESLASHWRSRELEIDLDIPETLPPLPAATEVAVYRIAQESLTNVVRHAGAGRARLTLSFEDAVLLTVEDDGVGIGSAAPGFGIRSMQARAEELGGTLVTASEAGRGTTVAVRIPLEIW